MTSVILSDSTGTYGIKRNDTDAVVVADNTAMTNVSTGVYSYTFSDPADDLTYTVALEVVYGGETIHTTFQLTGPTSDTGTIGTFESIYKAVSDYLGYGDSPSGDSLTLCKDIANDAILNFLQGYDPRYGTNYEWSFLHPETSITTTADQETEALPSGFTGLRLPFTHTSLEGIIQLKQYPVEHIRHLIEASDNQTDFPTCFAILPGAYTEGSGQTFEVMWYPTPDNAYTLNYSYDITPGALEDDADIVIGGAIHSTTIKALARAEAEARRHDGQNFWQAKAIQMMAASIENDKRNKPSNIGSYYRQPTAVPRVRNTVTVTTT